MYYFVSDIHLGGGTPEQAKITEHRFNAWIDSVAEDAKAIFMCGDLFDFWFEYKRVIPKGFVRTLGRLTALADKGVRIVLVVGNHDLWVRDYFEVECGWEVYSTPQIFDIAGRTVYVAHGDNLNIKQDKMLQLMNSGFRSKCIRAIFSALIHPNLALKFGQWWSHSSRKGHKNDNPEGLYKFRDSILEHCATVHTSTPCDLYIFGHLHILSEHDIEGGAKAIFINDWSTTPHYIVLSDEGTLKIEKV